MNPPLTSFDGAFRFTPDPDQDIQPARADHRVVVVMRCRMIGDAGNVISGLGDGGVDGADDAEIVHEPVDRVV